MRGTWNEGYAEGKRVYELAASEHDGAAAYLKATAARAHYTHAWMDGFKTGWSVARDDWPGGDRTPDQLAG